STHSRDTRLRGALTSEEVMRNRRSAGSLSAAGLALMGLALSGCGDRPAAPTAPESAPGRPKTSSPTEPSAATSAAECAPASVFDPANFTNSTRVDNRWYPLVPGTRYTLEGRADRSGVVLPHRVVLVVTDLVKVIGGARAVVLWDRDFNADTLA